ncbi:cupredoxin domain-containing protein [Pseudomonas sp. Fl4BN1]|uniref:cupredoxin domain-containing protein n=1 Tax=Pseudomonas sp. Fl4BN1 TaxID=2697651 RepID=UPI001377E260|nr:cupredoxin domain-containing protein [Pseudomonas sp. Fl4BN1]NBF11602.1 cupredoxin domain-containing protein [Pseudomonas sp. Fl4BN1]
MRTAVKLTSVLLVLCGGTALAAPPAVSEESPIKLLIENHRFTPESFSVPEGKRFRIELTSHDESVDEFESYDMKFEKILVPGNTISVFAGPLHPGTYTFFDDYHPDQAKGTVIVEKNQE